MRFFPLVLCAFILLVERSEAQQLPNILWIVSEDNSPYIGCYGDSLATTPNIDQLAKEGHLYTHAYANAPVCAPARNTIITGVYANSNGNQNMRSNYPLSDSVRFFPEYLRALGYYCTNMSKKDYNTSTTDTFWNESSLEAHYENREEGQPFFHVVNTSISHESSLHRFTPDSSLMHRPEEMVLPPYHPDTKEIRHDWAQYYDRITLMDHRVGEVLKELEESGQSENTIVFYLSDHGGVLARSKRFVYETGTHVPFVVRIPEKFKTLRPSEVGEAVDELISFVDMAPTMLSITDQSIPGYMQGRPFLGPRKTEEPEFVFMFRDRMDASYDLSRAVRSKKYRYIRNYLPHEIYGQYIDYLWKAPSVGSWEQECTKGNCNEMQMAFWKQKRAEELYDTENDPWEVNNLVDNPEYADVLVEMRAANRSWILNIGDAGFIPEQMLLDLVNQTNKAAYDLMRNDTFDLEAILNMAEKATEGGNIDLCLRGLKSEEAAVRFWAAVGLRIRCDQLTKKHKKALKRVLNDESPDVAVLAAETLYLHGENDLAINAIVRVLNQTARPFSRARALSFIREFEITDETVKATVRSTYNNSFEKDRFRYDLLASEVLMSKWSDTAR
ncbi:sulfatase-like hydrolase/transferase [Marinoscillum luteum]|uniref:Sulfatase-like hydrolase/transferase n=1 Tax=Marinoscillum luteum TaxID=861051 RepID=A0ABW7NDZ7_9BACT